MSQPESKLHPRTVYPAGVIATRTDRNERDKKASFLAGIVKLPAEESFSLEGITMRKRERRYER